jgi:hypothetical protein
MIRVRSCWVIVFVFCILSSGCIASHEVRFPETRQQQPSVTQQKAPALPEISDWGWSERIITEDELNTLEIKDPTLNPSVTHQILARLNSKAEFHIYDDIRKQRPLKVPNDFRAYRNWTPLPQRVEQLSHLPKCILVVKDIPFLGRYEHGKLVSDSLVGLGVRGEETDSGVYKILEKAVDKYSLSYRNDLGEPAWMPWAMRIYGTVWIHAGDVSGPYCSHGCVMLPMDLAEDLFHWTDAQTIVVVAESSSKLNLIQLERGRIKPRAR